MDDKPERGNRSTYVRHNSGIGFAYVLGMIGSAVYWVQQAAGFGDGIIALLKALVWPAFLIYQLLRFISG